MGCSHCMIEATPTGSHMPIEIYEKTLAFNVKYDPSLIFISGGEPTDHPQFLEYLNIAKSYLEKRKVLYVLVASNGMFLENESYTKEIIKIGVPFQITNDPRFYPQRIKKIEHPLFAYEDALRLVTPIGRAVTNNLETARQTPLCFNLRSLCRNYQNFNLALSHLRGISKMCSPSINVDGALVAGEASGCYKIGTVESSNEEITSNLKSMKCGKCLLHRNLTGIYKNLWEEMEK
jgi:hypothetical protein